MKSSHRLLASLVACLLLGALAAAPASAAPRVKLREARLSKAANSKLTDLWYRQLRARYGEKRWAPMRFDLGNRELRLMGLPSKRWMMRHSFRRPTFVSTTASKSGRNLMENAPDLEADIPFCARESVLDVAPRFVAMRDEAAEISL